MTKRASSVKSYRCVAPAATPSGVRPRLPRHTGVVAASERHWSGAAVLFRVNGPSGREWSVDGKQFQNEAERSPPEQAEVGWG
jgi:hypothetical protein